MGEEKLNRIPDHVPTWKYWLSFLWEQHVESRSSAFNPHLYVSLKLGRFQLSTANAVYSFGDMYTNFSRTFKQWNWDAYPAEEVLILGLGLGSIPVILEQVEQRNCAITAIEIDEEVVDLAERYVLYQLETPIQTIVANARAVVDQLPAAAYDLICIDLFDDDTVPAIFETTDFLEQAARLLQPGGILLFNRLADTAQDRQLSTAFFEQTFKQVFPNGYCLDVGGNYMLLSDGKGVVRG